MRFTSGQMGARRTGAPVTARVQPTAKSKRHVVAIPKGGAAEVRAADNGVIVSVRDQNYNRVSETVALGVSDVSFKKD